jgi:hypothetical protein
MTYNTGTPQCIDPTRVGDADIPAYLTGDARPEFVEHIKKCQFCQSEAAQFSALAQFFEASLSLTRPSSRPDCLDSQLLGEYALNLISGQAQRGVKNHLKSCVYCSAEVAELQAELLQPEPEMAVTPGFGLVASGILRRVVASLAQSQPKFALRGAASSGGGPKEFQAEELTIVVKLQPAKAKRNILTFSGTVVRDGFSPEDIAGAVIKLLTGDTELATEILDETGSFFFDDIAIAPVFSLEITLADKVVVVEDIQSS